MPSAAFKQCEVERLLRAAKAVGYEHPIVEKRADGTLRLLTSPPERAGASRQADEADLDGELEAWRRTHGDG